MCSREARPRRRYDAAENILDPLVAAHTNLKDRLHAILANLLTLSETFRSAVFRSATAQAAIIEALTLITLALDSIDRYNAFYAPLFQAPDPLVVLVQAGADFGDVRQEVEALIESLKSSTEDMEEAFRGLGEVFDGARRREAVSERMEWRRDEIMLARGERGRALERGDVEALLVRAGNMERFGWEEEEGEEEDYEGEE